jgi:hypothetical protein
MTKSSRPAKKEIVGLLGVGLDNTDGQTRVTRNEGILLVGGSKDTHECMQEVSIRLNKSLRDRGKRLPDAEIDEVIDLLHKASRK